MITLWIKEDQTIWLGLIISLLIHSLFFVLCGKTFIQPVHYSVQSSTQMVEVSIEEIKYSGDVLQNKAEVIKPQSKPLRTPSKIYEVKGTGNIYFQNPPPQYPELAKQMRQEGLVMLTVDVDRTGEPVSVEIIQSSGYRLLDQAALKAVSHWKFLPGRIGDLPVESKVTVPVRFQLEVN